MPNPGEFSSSAVTATNTKTEGLASTDDGSFTPQPIKPISPRQNADQNAASASSKAPEAPIKQEASMTQEATGDALSRKGSGVDFYEEDDFLEMDILDNAKKGKKSKATRESTSTVASEEERAKTQRLNLSPHKISHLPSGDRRALSEWDSKGNKSLSLSDVLRLAKQHKTDKEHHKKTVKIFIFVTLALLILLAGNTVATFMVVELSKEDHVKNGALVADSTGAVIQTASADISIGAGGLLTSRQCAATGHCDVSLNATEKPLAVMENKVQRAISSVIPSHLLVELKQIKLLAQDRVSELYLKVQGMMRVVAPGSRCGTVVKFVTNIGVVTFDDAIASVDAQAEAFLLSAGFELAKNNAVGFGGRRLSTAIDSIGFFNFFENYNWQCSSLAAPKSMTPPYRVEVTQQHPCVSQKCISKFRDFQGNDLHLPGVHTSGTLMSSQYEEIANDTHSVRLTKLPNHPDWTFVEITDHYQREQITYQMSPDGNAWHCKNINGSDYQDSDPFDMANNFTAVFNGYISTNGSEREFTLVPIDPNKIPMYVTYIDDAATFLPKRVVFQDARENDFDVESAAIDAYHSISAAAATALMNTYMDKMCLNSSHVNSSTFGLPVLLREDPYFEDKDAVKMHVSNIDDAMEMYANFIPAVTAKYGPYWGSLLDEWTQDSTFFDHYVRRLTDFDDSEELQEDPVNEDLLAPGADGEEDGFEMYDNSSQLPSAQLTDGRRLFSINNKIKLTNKCKVKFNLNTNTRAHTVCADIGIDGQCRTTKPGWYMTGGIAGCVGWRDGYFTLNGNACIGYTWSAKKGVNVRRRINIGCDVSVYGCFGVDSSSHDAGRRRGNRRRKGGRRRRRDMKSQVTFILRAGIQGSCSAGVKVKVHGGFNLYAGPCGSGFDNRLKGTIDLKGCVKIAIFKACAKMPTIQIFNANIPDC